MRGSAVVIGAGIAGLATARGLLGAGWSVRVVSMPSWDIFGAEDFEYQELVLPYA